MANTLHYVLDSSNSFLAVTNFKGDTTSTPKNILDGFILTTSDGSATGQLAYPVAIVGTPGFTVDTQPRQYSTSSNFAPGTADGTVFTLAAGEKGTIQNLDDAALYVKYGASATSSSFTVVLKAGAAANDGNGGFIVIDDWIGAVSVAAASGTARYLAQKLS